MDLLERFWNSFGQKIACKSFIYSIVGDSLSARDEISSADLPSREGGYNKWPAPPALSFLRSSARASKLELRQTCFDTRAPLVIFVEPTFSWFFLDYLVRDLRYARLHS